MGLGGTVAVQNRYMNAKTEVASGAEITAGAIDLSSKNTTTAAASAVGGAKTSNVGVTGMVSYMGGESNARVLVDSGASLQASVKGTGKDATTGAVSVSAENASTIINKAGLTDISKETAIGASVGVVSYDVLSEAKIKNFTADAAADKGTFSATAFSVASANTSTIKNSTVAGVTSGDESKPDEKKDTESKDSAGGAALKVRDEKTEEGGDSSEKAVELAKVSVSSEGKKEETTVKDPSAPTEADTEVAKDADGNADTQSDEKTEAQKKANSTVNIAAAGAVSWNDVKTSAIAEMSGITVTGVGDKASAKVEATDTSHIAADSGATALIKEGKEGETTKFGVTLAGGVAGNDLLKTTRATMDGVTLQNVASVSNAATNTGVQQATGMSVGTSKKAGKGFSAVASASVNYAVNRVTAEMKNVTTGGVVTNTAMDNDIQIAGGLSKEKTMQTVAAGAAVSINKVKNDISALIAGGTYGTATASATVTNAAYSNLTQIGGAASIGIAEGDTAYLGLNAAVAVNTVKNSLSATMEDATIYANGSGVTNVAKDGVSPGAEAQSQLISSIKEMVKEGFDALAQDAVKAVGKEIGLETDENGDPKTTGKAEEDKESQVEYTVEDYVGLAKTLTNAGNIISTGAFSLSKGTNASAAAAVSYASVQNDVKANIRGSTIYANNVSTESHTETLMVDAAIGSAYSKEAKGMAAAGSVALSQIQNTTEATIEDSKITVGTTLAEDLTPMQGSVTAAASNTSFLITAAGEATAGSTYAASGMGWAQNTLGNTTIAKVLGSTIATSNEDIAGLALGVTADNTSKVYAVGAGLGVGLGKGANIDGAFAGNTGTNSTQALVDKSDKNNKTTVSHAESVNVAASSASTQKAIAGNIGAGNKTVSVGGAVAVNKLGSEAAHQSVSAALKASDVTTVAGSAVSVSAKDKDSLLTVAAGGGVKAGGGVGVSAQGSVAVSRLYKDSRAEMESTSVDKESGDGNATVAVTAESTGNITGSGAAMSTSAGGGVNVGGAAGVSLVTLAGETSATVKGGKLEVEDASVKAKSERKVLNVGVGLGLAGGKAVSVNTEANVAVNKLANHVYANVVDAAVHADNNVVVSAANTSSLKNYGGGLSLSASSGVASVGVGATVAVNTISGDTIATVSGSDITAAGNGQAVKVTEYTESTTEKGKFTAAEKEKKGFVVTADSKQELKNVSVTAGIGAAAKVGVSVEATVATNQISGTTAAKVLNTDINQYAAEVGDAAVLAHDETNVSSIVGTLGVGGGALAGVDAGAAVDTNTFSRDTSALVEGAEKKTVNAKDLSVRASSAAEISAIEQDAGVGGGFVGVGASGAVSVNRFTGTTTAAMTGVEAEAESADVSANTAKKTSVFTGSYNAKAGMAAVSATAGVITVRDESKTTAAIDRSALETAKAASVYAGNTEQLSTKAINVSAAFGLGAGVGAAVSVNNLENTVSASVSDSNISAGTDASVKARNDFKLESTNASAGAGIAGVGVGVALNNIRSATAVSVSGGSLTAKNIDVEAKETRAMEALGVAAAAGLAGIGTNVNINHIGTALADAYAYDGGSYSTSEIRQKALDGLATADKATAKLASSGYAKEAGATATSHQSEQANDAGWNSQKTDTRTPGVSTSLSGATLTAEKNVNISGEATTNGQVNLAQGAVGAVGVNVAVGITDIKTNNQVTVEGSTVTGQKLTVAADNDGSITQEVHQASAGAGAVNVAVSRLIRSGENAVNISASTLKAETHRVANAAANANESTELNISALESLQMTNRVEGTGFSGVGVGVLLATVEDKLNNTIAIDNGSKLSAVDYTTVTTRATETKLDATGKLVTATSDVETEKPEYKEIRIAAANTSKSTAESYVNAAAAVSGDAAKATAIIGTSDHKTGINQISIGQNNTLEAADLHVLSTNAAEASAKVGSVGAGLVTGGGVVSRAEAYGTSEVGIGDGTKIVADNVNVLSLGKMKTNADTRGINVGLVDVVVNRAYANLYGQVGVRVGDISFTSHQWVDTQTKAVNENGETQIVAGHITSAEGGALTMGAYDDSTNTANVDGKTVGGAAASGTNEAYTESDSHVTMELSAKSMDAKSVTLAAGSGVTSIAKANGDGGGIVNISPVAAKAVNSVKSDTKLVVSGNYNISGDFSAATVNHANTKMMTDALSATVAGAGGTSATNTADQKAETTVSDAVIQAGGKVGIGAENNYTFSPIDGQNYIVKGNGYGALSVATAGLTNTVNSTATTNLGHVTSEGEQKYWAETTNNITSDAFVYALGVVGSGAFMSNELNVKSDNLVTTKAGTTLKTLGKDSDIIFGVADEETITNRAKAENSAGLAGAVFGKTTNNITRNNKVKIDGNIYGRRNVSLYAGKFDTDEFSTLNLKTDAEVFNRSVIPISGKPSLVNNFTQNNIVDINGNVESVQNVNLYADAGKENISWFVGFYTAYGGKGDPQYVAKTNGKLNVDQDGNPTGGNYQTDNHVTVTGNVTAGVSHYQKVTIGGDTYQGLVVLTKEQYEHMSAYYQKKGQSVPANYVALLSDADYEKLTAAEKANAAYRKMSDFVKIYDEDGNETDKAGISASDFTVGTYNYVSNIESRITELVKLIREYPEGSSARLGYEAEYASLMQMLVASGLATYDEAAKDYKVSGELYVNYINLPDMVASGGNINAQTSNISGSGTLTAKGTPTIDIENNTSLATNVHSVIVTEPGGKMYYNTLSMDSAADIAKANQDTSRTVGALHVSEGQAGTITIHGNAQKSAAMATDQMHYLVDGEEKTVPVVSDINIRGEVYAKDGTVEIRSQADDIVVSGKNEKTGKETAIHGKTVKLIASQGSVTQSYIDGIENIGGDVKEQYKNQYTADYKKVEGETKTQVSGAQVVSTSGGRIAGGNIFINAADVNLNGTVQSGYDNFYVTISADTKLDDQNHISASGTKTVENRLAEIESSNAGRNVTDHSVLGNPNYCVITGGETYNEEKGYYEYVVPVYYNPTTKTLLTPDVESKGGNIFINGRLSSTGSGKIICLDGVSDIQITNNLSNDLTTGNLVANDVEGVVRLGDTQSKTITEITRDGDGNLNYKTYSMVKTDDTDAGDLTWDSAKNGWNADYTYLTKSEDGKTAYYHPTTGLRYNWTEGKQVGTTTTYEATWYKKWWGLSSSKSELEQKMKDQQQSESGTSGPSSEQGKTDGTYIGVNNKATTDDVLDVFDYYKVTENTSKIDEERHWSQGFFGCHKYTYIRWTNTKGEEFARTYSVKADQSVPITFIGAMDGNSKTSVVSQGNIELAGSVGNVDTYQDASGVSVKGHVTIESKTGNIVQTGGAIYGADVSLTAAGDIKDIEITAGDSLNLSAVNKGSLDSQNISVTVSAAADAKGNVNLTGAGYAGAGEEETDSFKLVTKGKEGNIVTADGTIVSAKRIDLTSTNGGITADVNAGQMPIDSDTLSASVNAKAAKNITLTQKTGDMRIGTIDSTGGDVTINVAGGSVIDALPYGTLKTSDESALLEKWRAMGLLGGSDTGTSMMAEKQEAIDAYNAQAEKEGKEKIENYTAWDEKALLYTIEDSVINPTSDTLPSTSDKAPNVKGNNITINVKNNAGLDSDTETTINSKDFGNAGQGLENLKTVAKADASTVTVKNKEDGSKDFIIKEKLPIGVQTNAAEGKLTIGKIENGAVDKSEGHIYVQGRTEEGDIKANKDLTIASVQAKGDVSIAGLGNIYNGAADAAAIVAKSLYIASGANASVGTAEKAITTDLAADGNLRAIGVGVYIDNIGDHNLAVKSVSSGGDIVLSATKDIVMADEDTGSGDALGRIQVENDGSNITIVSREGSVGTVSNKADDTIEYDEKGKPIMKGVRVRNSESGKGLVTVKAAKDVAIVGVTNATGGQTPGGVLHVAVSGVEGKTLENIGLRANGTLLVDGALAAEKTVRIESTTDLALNNTVSAGTELYVGAKNVTQESKDLHSVNVKIAADENITLKGNSLKADNNVTLQAGKTITAAETIEAGNDVSMTAQNMTQEKGAVSGKNVTVTASKAVTLSGGSIKGTETHISAGTDLTQAKAHTVETEKLVADSTGELTIEGTKNQMADAVLDSKRTADGNAIVFHNGVGDSKVTVKNSLDTTHSHVKGDLSLENSSDGTFNVYNLNANNITVNGNGDVTTGLWTENTDIYADGKLQVTGKSVTNMAKHMGVAGDISLQSTNGNVINRALLLSTSGDITLSANEGRVMNVPDADVVTLNGNVTMTAKASDTETVADMRNGSVYNFGNLLANAEAGNTDKGNVRLVSETADVYNYDDFREASYEVDGKTYSIAVHDIEMSAASGVLYTGQEDLVAGGKITLTAKEGLSSIGTNILAGHDVSITATDGSIYNGANIASADGSVTIKAEKGSVVNTLSGNILAGGGNAELIAGGATEENRPFYMASTEGDAKAVTPSVDGADITVVKAYKYYKSNTTGAYERITDETDVDALSKAERESIVTIASYVDADGKDRDLSFTGDGVETVIVSVTEGGRTETKTAIKGDMEFFRAGDVLNRGDVVAMGKTEQQEDGTHTVEPGTITLRSDHGDVINYDNFYKVNGKEYELLGERKYFIATGNIGLVAPEGNFYNDFAFSTAGDLTLSAKGDMTVGKDFSVADVAGDIHITSSEGKIYNGSGSTLVAGKDLHLSAAQGIENEGSLVGGNNVSIQTETGDINSTGDAHALNGAVEAVAKYGNVNLAEVTGDRVLVTAGGEDHKISIEKVEVGSYLKLHGDYIDTPNEVQHGDSYRGVIHFDIAGGVENSMVKGPVDLQNAGDSVFDTLHVTDADIRITGGGKFDSDRIRVHGNADISAMGSKTAIFSAMPKAGNANYVYADSGDWMSLHIEDGHNQRSNGLLVRRDDGYYADYQRFTLEDLARQYTGYKMFADAYSYLGNPIVFFNRYNILENAVTFSSGAEDGEEFTIV